VLVDVSRYVVRRLRNAPLSWLKIGAETASHQLYRYPKVTILVPTRDRVDLLKTCIDSILDVTTYPNFEIVILDNDSIEAETKRYFQSISDSRVQVLHAPGDFNYSKIMNAGVKAARGELICSLNNDTKVLNAHWLNSMVVHLDNSSAGVVGALLTFEDGAIQHAGIALGYTGVAGHVFRGESLNGTSNQAGITDCCYPVSAVTFACALTARDTWIRAGGLDEKLKVGLNDVDYCLRLKSIGLASVLCTNARLVHFESQSRKSMKSMGGIYRAFIDIHRFSRKHKSELGGDPFFKQPSESSSTSQSLKSWIRRPFARHRSR
jgi:GT2 family glycosyltransferase